MQDELNNILSNEKGNIGRDQLLKYLKDELNESEKHELETHLLEDSFDSDAVEGLQEIENKEKIQLIVDGLNRDLKKRSRKRKNKRERLKLKPLWAVYFSILILLVLIVMIYFFLHSKMNG